MAENENALLERFVGTGDTEAFGEIIRRYAGLVYGTCMRVLADADKAADATQETFFQLMKRAGKVRGSLAGWLHRVATGTAVDLVRKDSARRQRERVYLDDRSGEDSTWREASSYVDEALTQLDDNTRTLLVCHFLEGVPMAEIARQRGVSRPTISREVESALTRLRAQLQRQGVLATAATLATLLSESTAQSAPAALLQQLGKMTMLGAQAGTTAASAASLPSALAGGLAAAVNVKFVVVAAVVIVGAGLITYTISSSGPLEDAPPAVQPSRQGRPASSRATVPSERPAVERPTVQPPDQRAETPANAAAAPPAQVAAPPQKITGTQPVAPMQREVTQGDDPHPDLSSPQATARSFTKAIIRGDRDAVMACMLPGGTDFEDVQELLNAPPDDPDRRSEYQMKLWFQALDPDAEMPIVSSEETERGTSVLWRVTFKHDFTVEGHTFRAGETYDLDATLRQSGDSWLIDGI
jgi:RNA polymerase sigma factor (sigma-70 family)